MSASDEEFVKKIVKAAIIEGVALMVATMLFVFGYISPMVLALLVMGTISLTLLPVVLGKIKDDQKK